MKYQLWGGENKTRPNIGSVEIAGAHIGVNSVISKLRCIKIILDYKQNALGVQ
jgi:hypothetical protein